MGEKVQVSMSGNKGTSGAGQKTKVCKGTQGMSGYKRCKGTSGYKGASGHG